MKNSGHGARLSHSRSGLGYLGSRERGWGCFERKRIVYYSRGRFKEPGLLKERETSKKTGAR